MSDSDDAELVDAVEGAGGSGDEAEERVEAVEEPFVIPEPPVRADPFPVLRPELVETINKERRQAGWVPRNPTTLSPSTPPGQRVALPPLIPRPHSPPPHLLAACICGFARVGPWLRTPWVLGGSWWWCGKVSVNGPTASLAPPSPSVVTRASVPPHQPPSSVPCGVALRCSACE
jgi:hypothetical protein